MSAKHNKEKPASAAQPAYGGLSPHWRWIISGFLVLHLFAIFIPPFAFQTSVPMGGLSPAARWAIYPFRPYCDAVHLNHGYAFFAPDPGASHLIKYKLEFDDGRPPIEQTFPDIERHWPRLLYHRHFMLSEHLNGSFQPPRPPQGLSPERPRKAPGQSEAQWREVVAAWEEALESWSNSRGTYEARWAAFENHLLHKYGAQRVTMTRVQHRLPLPVPGQEGINLLDESLYSFATRDEPFPEPAEGGGP